MLGLDHAVGNLNRLFGALRVTTWEVPEGLHGMAVWIGRLERRGMQLGLLDHDSGAFYLLDEEAWRDQTVQDAASVHAVAEDVRQRLGKARAAAEAASPVAPGTLTAEVYAERPWFLQTAETELER